MLNTLDYSEALADAGVPPDQARAQAKALSEALESNDLATKTDIANLEATTSANLKSEMADMKTDMAKMETRIIKWQIGGIGVLAAIMKFL